MQKAIACQACDGHGFVSVFSHDNEGACSGVSSHTCDICNGNGVIYVDASEFDKVKSMSFVGEMGANMAIFAHEQEKQKNLPPKPAAQPEGMEIDLGFTKLIAEKFDNDNGQGFVIGMYDANGDWQDIAVVENENGTQNVRCFVYGDASSEDYTNKFVIDQYKT